MAKKKGSARLDRALELWAAWCFSGGENASSASMLARLIDNHGELIFGGSAGSSAPARDLEGDIEACLLRMAIKSPMRAAVLRLECGICGPGQRWLNTTQTDRALMLGIGYSTYCRHLAKARETIEKQVLGA